MKNDHRTTRELHLERKEMWDASMQNHTRYLSAETALFDPQYLTQRACPACQTDETHFLFHKSGGTYVACEHCDMVYLNPVFKDDVLDDYYRNNHQLQGRVVSDDIGFYAALYKQGLQAIAHHTSSGHILDIGCSTGIFLDIARESGWQCHGLELNHEEAQVARAKGHAIQKNPLDQATFDQPLDAITLWDVFEHIKDGFSLLAECRKRLSPAGIVFIQSPSRDALAAQILQSRCNMFDGLEHVNLYGMKSMQMLSEKAGFDIISFQTVISEIGVINNYLEYRDPYLGSSTNKKDIFGVMDEQWIHAHNRGYKFQICLRVK